MTYRIQAAVAVGLRCDRRPGILGDHRATGPRRTPKPPDRDSHPDPSRHTPPARNHWLHRVRERIEGTFHAVQHTGRHLEHLWRKTVVGLVIHVMAKMSRHTLQRVLRRFWGLNVPSFTTVAAI